MANVYKMTEIVGSSPKGFAEAVQEAVKRASKTLRLLPGFATFIQERPFPRHRWSSFSEIRPVQFLKGYKRTPIKPNFLLLTSIRV